MTPKLVNQELSQQVIAGAIIAIVLLPIWIPFDYLIDPLNFKTFLTLRIIGIFVILSGLIVFISTGKQVAHYRKSAMLTYLTLIVSMLPMCVLTSEKLPYYIGFSTVFFAVSILVVWPLRYFVLPMLMAAVILGIAHWNTSSDLKSSITGMFLMINVFSMSGVASWLTYRNFLKNESLLNQLENLSNTDRLTGLHNRRYFDLRLHDVLAHAHRNDTLTAVMMLDVDHFKKYNDHYGHQQGDECLRQFSDCLRKALSRETDFVARYGGEEFVVVMPDTDVGGAEVVANRIIAILGDIKIPHCQSPVASFVTASIGIACTKAMSPEEMVALADSALYKAKQSGRNRFVVA
jgi:diguanylate cyclase (GGDEF)-like protein